MTKAYYAISQIGTGASEDDYRPDLPTGYFGWVVCTDVPVQSPDPMTWVVLVSGDAAYHAVLKASPNALWIADVEEEVAAT